MRAPIITRSLVQLSRSYRLAGALHRANAARDRGDLAEAAQAYAIALQLAPDRTGLRVQLGNMLKDSLQFEAAEQAYLAALEAEPLDADIHLQLGHLNKLMGRRGLALASYRRALELQPRFAPALRELAAAGDPDAQLSAFDTHMRQGGTEALLEIRSRLDEIADQLRRMRERLPDALAAAAFPIEAYDEFRRIFDVPPPVGVTLDVSIEVVLAADDVSLEDVYAQISAIQAQSYPNWRLVVVTRRPDRRAVVERASESDARIRLETPEPAEGVAQSERRLGLQAIADWILFASLGSRPHPHLLSWIAAAASKTDCAVIVMDEEVGRPGAVSWPEFRQSFDRDTLLEANVWGETIAIRHDALTKLPPSSAVAIGESRSELLLNLDAGVRVAHVPLPLTCTPGGRWRSAEARVKAHARAVRMYLRPTTDTVVEPSSESGTTLRVERAPRDPQAALSVIIPTKDNIEDVTNFIRSLTGLAARPDRLNILVLNNGAPSSANSIRGGAGQYKDNISVCNTPGPFNWSRLNNLGASKTTAPILLFANDDMKMVSPRWDDVIRTFLERSDVGAVGARLMYPDYTLQHGGILFDWRGSTVHDGLHRASGENGPALRWQTTRATSAVTGAFLATRRADFEAVEGFDELALAVAYSDVDYCLKLRALGLRILWTPMISALHFESKTRGLDHLDPAKRARDAAEFAVFRERWKTTLDSDPSLNPFWVQATLPHRLIAFPSAERVWAHIETSARANPWRVSQK